MFMSDAAATPASTTAPPVAIGRVLGVLRWLINHGKQLTATLQQRAAAPGFALFARRFGTRDLAVILARIIAALRRAAALEAALNQRAARGRDLAPTPVRLPATRSPGAGRWAAAPAPAPTDPVPDPHLADLPTEEEIAAEVRRRPVGAVIVDICRDLGIAPGELDRAFWDELAHAIMAYGGSLVVFYRNLDRWPFDFTADDHADLGWPVMPLHEPVPATGPP